MRNIKEKTIENLSQEGKLSFYLTEKIDNENNILIERMGPKTKDFFHTYKSVFSNKRGVIVDISLVRPSEYIHGMISIGHSEDWDICVEEGSDNVYVVESSVNRDDPDYASIWEMIVEEMAS